MRGPVLLNSTSVWSCSSNDPIGRGEAKTLSPNPIVGADANPTPPQRVAVDASTVQVPDIKIVGSGTEARIEFQNFRQTDATCTARSGSARDMTGASLDVILRAPVTSAIVGHFSVVVPQLK